MNSTYFKLPASLKKAYHKAFTADNDSVIFHFLRKYLQFIENDSSSFNVLLLFEDPLSDDENKFFMRDLNRNCKNFLETRKGSTSAALCYIGVAHEYGLFDFERDYVQAFDMYTLSSQLNHDLGTYRLAQCYEQGKGTSNDAERALYFYRCAAKLGLVDALHVYGSILANGFMGCKADQKTGLHYLSLAAVKADRIYPYPLFDIGKWYESKTESLDVCVDEQYSFDVYMKGAGLKDPNCQYRIARCYENGELGKKKNIKSAVKWYFQAAEAGQIDAQMMLFGLYASGIPGCIEKDSAQSYYWALRAGIRENHRAGFFLGEYARIGMGIKQDILLALWWYTISASMGSHEARIKMEETKEEIERRDSGPEIPYSCCGISFNCF